jgi:hypothetical protein
VGAGDLRDQVQAEPAEGGIPIDGRDRRRVPRGVADLQQPPRAGGGHGHVHRSPTVAEPVAHQFLEGQQQPVHVVVVGAGRPGAVGEVGAELHPERTELGERGRRSAQDRVHRRAQVRPRPLHPQRVAHEPSSGDGAGRGRGT